MISAIVFSRERACQLDLLLNSLLRNAPGLFDVTVLWYARKDDFREAYAICEREHPEAEFIPENGLTYQVRHFARLAKGLTFFTDDSVLFREVTLEPILILSKKEVLCFSLRLGKNTTVCYPLDLKQIPPATMDGDVCIWRWKGAQGDFSYPMSLDGHVFRAADILPIIEARHFSTPNNLEELLMQSPPPRSQMASYPHSCLVGIPANRVNTTHPNRHANSFDAEDLNVLYLRGRRINLDALDFSDIRGAHQEIVLKFR
jgi:hypothetical protein